MLKKRGNFDGKKYEAYEARTKKVKGVERKIRQEAFVFAMKSWYAQFDNLPTGELTDTQIEAFDVFYRMD